VSPAQGFSEETLLFSSKGSACFDVDVGREIRSPWSRRT
jgi:hypothetical protein